MQLMKKLRKELALALARDQFDISEGGIYFPRQGALAKGSYIDRVNGGEWQESPNLIVDEGLAYMLSVAFCPSTAKPSAHYLALFSGSAAPAANWTASNFASVASEIVSQSEGYTSATRPVWTPPSSTATNSVDNMASVASLTIATATALNVTGAALLTNSTRGGTTGKLMSATKYSTTRVFQDADVFEVGYRVSLTV